MEAYLQQEKIMNMLRQPIPGKRVDLIRLQVVREGLQNRRKRRTW